MAKIGEVMNALKPGMIMVVVQAIYAVVNILYKLAANDGMSLRILVAYRFLFGAAFILPVALYVERNRRPKLTWTLLFQSFLCGLFGGSLMQNMYAESLVMTSATFAAAMTNLISAITYILSILFRLERMRLGTAAGKAKLIGTLVGIGGAMLLTFYKGPEINIWKTHFHILHKTPRTTLQHHPQAANWVFGLLLALGSCCCYALWLIVQAKMVKEYPCPYSATALMSVMGSAQSVIYALCIEKDNWKHWKLGWNIRLIAVLFTGIVASGVMFTMITWCVKAQGPLFVSIFSPLMLVLVALLGSLLLDEKLHLGSVIGAIIIVCGLYIVLWGKRKEAKKISQLMPSEESNQIQMTQSKSLRRETSLKIATEEIE